MNAQQRFMHYLRNAQDLCPTPEKMPYLCVVGRHDFDELRGELDTMFKWHSTQRRVAERVSKEWDLFNTSCEQWSAFRERVEQEEFDKEPVGTALSQSPAEAEAEAALDPRQRASMTECLEYCGCKCFRSLSEARGFWFA